MTQDNQDNQNNQNKQDNQNDGMTAGLWFIHIREDHAIIKLVCGLCGYSTQS